MGDPKVIETVISEGFDASVVEFYARRKVGCPTCYESLKQLVQDRLDLEEDCSICFFPYGFCHAMLLRPCCSQAICSQCDSLCHAFGKPCAFCRSTCGPVRSGSV